MTISPTAISLSLVIAIAIAVAALLVWGVRIAPRRRARRLGAVAPAGKGRVKNRSAKTAAPGQIKATPSGKGKAPKPPTSAQDLIHRRYAHASKLFVRAMNKRIGREPLTSERLRHSRDLAIGWYGQNGQVPRVRFQVQDPRTACKVCSGRNNKEYDLLKADVIAQILPPCHPEGDGRHECNCSVSAILAQ